MPNLLRHRRHISETTRSHNEYQRSDRNTKNSPTILPSTPRTPSCVAGTRWKEDCNSCWCLATGASACTRMRCPNFTIVTNENGERTVSLNSIQERGGKHSRVRRSVTSWIPGVKSGSAIRNLQKRSNYVEKSCENGSTWMWKCNRCHCVNGHAACTRMRCHDD